MARYDSTPLASTKAMEKLKLAIKRNKRLSSHEDTMDIVNHESLKQTLADIITETEQCIPFDADTLLARNISEWLVDRIAFGKVSMPTTSTTTSTTTGDGTSIPGETMMAALVLQTLHNNNGELPFAQLKEQVLHLALDQQCDAQQAVRAVYTLVANALVDIDRSTRDNMVRLI
ncbi:hypothetical protein BDF22DRAFT_742422 [Syncephalis plumigaleata]|nr:hypothetical protein BDF22DRAFT_742422 [Syncephalis plumigaleata]